MFIIIAFWLGSDRPSGLIFLCPLYFLPYSRNSSYLIGAQWVLPMKARGETSQLDLPSLTPLSIAGCGQLQLGVPHWATSVITANSW